MKRTYWIGVGVLAFLFLAAGSLAAGGPAEATGSPLAEVPAKAPIVIQVRGVEQNKDRLIAMIKEALPDLAGKVEEKINEHFTKGLEGRSLKAVVKNGPLFIVFSDFPKSGESSEFDQKLAVLVHVTTYAEFRDTILTEEERKAIKKEDGLETTQIQGEDFYFADRGSYVVVAKTKEAAKAMAKKPAQGLDSKLARDLAAKLLDSDLSVYVDMAAVRGQFGAQIAQVKEEAEKKLGEAEDVAGLQKQNLETVKKLIGPVFQAIDDTQAIVLAFDFRKPGLAVHASGAVAGNSKTNQFLKNGKPLALEELGKLPAGLMSYSAMQVHPEMLKAMGSYLYGAAGDNENKEVKAALEALAEAKPRLRLEAAAIPLRGIQVWYYEDPAKAVAAQLKLLKAVKGGQMFQAAAVKEPVVKEKAEKYGNFQLHSFSAQWDFEKMAQEFGGANVPEEAQKKMLPLLKKWFGEEIHVWFGTDGKATIQVIAKDWKAAQALLDQYTQGKKTVGELPAFKETRQQLPKETSFITMADVPKYLRMVFDVVQVISPIPLPLGAPANAKPSYIGMAVTVRPERGSFDLWIPGTTAQEIYKAVQPLINAFGAFGGAS